MQYLGEGEKSSWMVYVKDAMVDRDYDDLVEKYAERITYNAKAINAIEA